MRRQRLAVLEQTETFRVSGFGYFQEQATRPQAIGYALLDSPLALAGRRALKGGVGRLWSCVAISIANGGG